MVEAKTAVAERVVVTPCRASRSAALPTRARARVTLSHLAPPLRSACSTSSGTASESGARQLVGDIASLDAAPQAVGAQQQAVAGLHQQRPAVSTTGLPGLPRQVNSTLRLTRSSSRHDVAHASAAARNRSGRACGDELVAAHEVQPRIAAMRPVGRVALQQAGDDRGARRVDQRLLRGIAQQLVMAGDDGVVQEAQRVGQRRLGVALEQRGQRLQRELRGDLAFGVAAHAVGQREQAGVPRVAVAHAVFVLLAAALAADLVDREPHRGQGRRRDGLMLALRGQVSSCSFSRSLKLSLV